MSKGFLGGSSSLLLFLVLSPLRFHFSPPQPSHSSGISNTTIEITLSTASCRSLSRPPCRNSPATRLLLVAFQRMILQPLYWTAVKFCSRLGLEPCPLQICIHFDLLMFFFVDYHFLSFRRCLRHFIFASHRISWVGPYLLSRTPLSLFHS